MNVSFWRGRRVLVTGHTGFKGAWLAQWLARAGAKVSGFSLDPPTSPSLFELARVKELLERDLRGDVRDEAAVREAHRACEPEAVFHLAAQPLVRASYERPLETFAVNVQGTAHVLEAARATETVRAVVIVTSDKCYENREWVWGYREDEAMGGHDPYSASKGCAELVTASYRKSFFAHKPAPGSRMRDVAVGSGRAGNVIGGGDWAEDRLVPDAVRAFLAGEKVTLRNPLATRPWQHVLEPLAGYLALGEALLGDDRARAHAHASGWNFGPSEESVWPVQRVVETLARHWGVEAPGWAPTKDAHPHEAHSLQLDATKARRALGLTPRWSTDEALARIARFHRALAAGEDARSLCARDLTDYEEALTR